MNRDVLAMLLKKEGISSDRYSLNGDLQPGRIVLYKNYKKWEVFYFDEHGSRQMLKTCNSEASACNFIHQELLIMMFSDVSIFFSQRPIILPQTAELIKQVDIIEFTIRVWFDSIIEHESFFPKEITTSILELEKNTEFEKYKIRFWGSKRVNITNGLVHFSVDYQPFHDWVIIESEKSLHYFEREISDIICRLIIDKDNTSYHVFGGGRTLCVGFRNRIHKVPIQL